LIRAAIAQAEGPMHDALIAMLEQQHGAHWAD
jgi:hypothetical protein